MMNRNGKRPDKLISEEKQTGVIIEDTFHNMVGQEDLDRFSKPKANPRKKKRTPARGKKVPLRLKKSKDNGQ